MIAVMVPPHEILSRWFKISEILERAEPYSQGRCKIDDLFGSIVMAKAQCWIVVRDGVIIAAAVTEVRAYPVGKVLAVLAAAGDDMNSWLDELISKFKRFATFNGAVSIELVGRKGWLKVLGKKGFEDMNVVTMELKLV